MAVDYAGADFHDAAPVSHLSLAGAQSIGFVDFLHIGPGVQLAQDADRLFGPGDGLDFVVDDQRNFGDLLDLVTLGHDQGRDSRRRDRRRHRESLLVDVDAVVPSAPRFGRREHATSAAHVAESSLARAVSAAAAYAGNTGHGATGAPGRGRGLLT